MNVFKKKLVEGSLGGIQEVFEDQFLIIGEGVHADRTGEG